MQVESFANESEILPLEEDTAMDFLFSEARSDIDAVMDEIDDYTEDPDILEDFAERQGLSAGSTDLLEELVDYHSRGPQLSGGDVDADWESSDVSGEESVGGSAPTPDQDVVEELGEAVGIVYDDHQELDTEDMLGDRDKKRWELDPRSADDEEDEDITPDDEFNRQQDLDDF
jgi:hypothetical protein